MGPEGDTDLGDRLIFFTFRQVRNEKAFMTVLFAKLSLQVRTWNFPALVMYFMPLKGLYFSPYISRRFTLSPRRKEDGQLFKKEHVACLFKFILMGRLGGSVVK